MKNVIINIDGEFHQLVKDKQEFKCEDCSLFKFCVVSGRNALCGFFSNELAHFELLEDGIVEDYEYYG